MDIKFIICFSIIVLTIIFIYLPQKLIDRSTRRFHCSAILMIVSMSLFIIDKNIQAIIILVVLCIGLCVSLFISNYFQSQIQQDKRKSS